MIDATKTCRSCQQSKPLGAFNRYAYSKDGRSYDCRDCWNATKRRRRTDPEVRAREVATEKVRLRRPDVAERVRAMHRRYRANPENRIYILAQAAIRRARVKGLEYDPDISDLLPPPEVCPALGVAIDYSSGKGHLPNGPSIDRIDNTKGYVKGNRIVVSRLANQIKTNATPEQIRRVATFYEGLLRNSD